MPLRQYAEYWKILPKWKTVVYVFLLLQHAKIAAVKNVRLN